MKIDWKNIRIMDLAAIILTQLIERDIDAVCPAYAGINNNGRQGRARIKLRITEIG
ncbi:MAG: hypothetical protein JSW20_11195 [Nitrospiraceae bacterium]|nr:MAG: hypothetical protein JSW20_11195 [Nitrospiraceae bacterium]